MASSIYWREPATLSSGADGTSLPATCENPLEKIAEAHITMKTLQSPPLEKASFSNIIQYHTERHIDREPIPHVWFVSSVAYY